MNQRYEHNEKLPRLNVRIQYNLGNRIVKQFYVDDIPGEIMDFYESVVGNALARVGATAEISDKDYGKGVSCSVFVSLSCNQDQITIDKTAQAAGAFALGYAKAQLEVARKEFIQIAQNNMVGNLNTPNFG